MVNISRKKVEGLLKQAGFSEQDLEKIELLSDCPIPVLRLHSHTQKEIQNMWKDIFDGKAPFIKEVSAACYQCLLFGRAIGVKIITTESDLRNPGEWKKESKIEVAVYRKDLREKWEKFTIIQREDRQPDTISDPELSEVARVAKFIELLIEEQEKNCRLSFPGA